MRPSSGAWFIALLAGAEPQTIGQKIRNDSGDEPDYDV
jgi:hypothetical protein